MEQDASTTKSLIDRQVKAKTRFLKDRQEINDRHSAALEKLDLRLKNDKERIKDAYTSEMERATENFQRKIAHLMEAREAHIAKLLRRLSSLDILINHNNQDMIATQVAIIMLLS